MRVTKRTEGIFITLLVLLAGSVYSFFSLSRHLRFESFGFDLGIYDQILWLGAKGEPLFSSLLDFHPWGDHLTPSLLLLSPLYWLWDNVAILLLFQAFFAAFGAVPVFLLAKKTTNCSLVSAILSFAYLAFFGIQNALAFDFHPIVLATTLLAWLFYFYETKRTFWFWATLIIFLGLQENFALTTFALGIYFAFKDKKLFPGVIVSLLGIGWFLLAVFILTPHFRGEAFLYTPYHWQELGALGMIKALFYPWSKTQVMFVSFLSFGLLPLLAPLTWILFLEEYFQRFVGNSSPNRWGLGFQYNSILAPILTVGAMQTVKIYFRERDGLSQLGLSGVRLAALLIFLGWVVVQIFFKPSLNLLLQEGQFDYSKSRTKEAILRLIPQEASVAATNNLVPHLSHRKKIILLTNCLDDPTVWKDDMKRCLGLTPDYLIADMDPKGSINNYYPDNSRETIRQYLDYVLRTGEYQLVVQNGPLILLKKSS